MKRVTGIGGLFFKTSDPESTKSWYEKHLGIKMDAYGAVFISRKPEAPAENQYLQWSPFKRDTDYFLPSDKEFMVNYRVENLEKLVAMLKDGKFVHIMDNDGNKIELWEPVDAVFDDFYKNNE